MVSSVGVYFERAKEQVLFLYPTLDLNPLDPFNIVKGRAMGDDAIITFPTPESFSIPETESPIRSMPVRRNPKENDVLPSWLFVLFLYLFWPLIGIL